MDRILYTAMSGASQTMAQQEVVSHNLANVSTSGFRAQLHAARAVPVEGVGALPTRVSTVASTPGADFRAGPITRTGRALDIALEGEGWIAVQAADGGEAYTRRGDLQLDGAGMLTSNGRPVTGEGGPLMVPPGADTFIGSDGTVSVIGVGENPKALVAVGRIKLVDGRDARLQRGDDGLFRPPPGADGNIVPLPASETLRVASGALEGSNVSAVETMVSMIDLARRYEMQMKVIGTADENAQRANSLLSLQG